MLEKRCESYIHSKSRQKMNYDKKFDPKLVTNMNQNWSKYAKNAIQNKQLCSVAKSQKMKVKFLGKFAKKEFA